MPRIDRSAPRIVLFVFSQFFPSVLVTLAESRPASSKLCRGSLVSTWRATSESPVFRTTMPSTRSWTRGEKNGNGGARSNLVWTQYLWRRHCWMLGLVHGAAKGKKENWAWSTCHLCFCFVDKILYSLTLFKTSTKTAYMHKHPLHLVSTTKHS